MKLEVLNIQGQQTGREIELPEDVFGVEPNEHVVYLAVKQYLAAQRQGTHKAKERNEIAGSTKKLKRQKGTGTARFGDIKNPVFRGGGRIFGPRPRKYNITLNKKVKLKKRKETPIDANLTATLNDGALMKMMGYAAKGEVEVRLKGKAKGGVFIFSKKIDIDETKKISTSGMKMGF